MEVIKTDIDGVLIIEPKVFGDARGYFFESFSQHEFDEKVGRVNFVQDNESKTSYGSDMTCPQSLTLSLRPAKERKG